MTTKQAGGIRPIATVVRIVAVFTALLSAASWTYRFIDEHARYGELAFYVLVPGIIWLMFAAPLFLLCSGRNWLRVTAAILLVPASLLWVLSILVGLYGLKIH